jgi:hypothetical protein
MAALIDGEGSIHIINDSKKESSYILKLKITMTNRLVLEKVQERFGGRLHGPYMHSGLHNLPTWEWNITSRAVYNLLLELYPYMIVKREQAHIAIDFYHASFMCRGYRNQYNPITDQEIKDRHTWYLAMKFANKYGVDYNGKAQYLTEEEDSTVTIRCTIESENSCRESEVGIFSD